MESLFISAIVLAAIYGYRYYKEVQERKEAEENRFFEQLMAEKECDKKGENNENKDKEIEKETKKRIKETFAKNKDSKTHSRHFDRDKCKEAGLEVIDLEEDNELQDIVLSIHHCCMILAEQTPVIKIVENNIGGCYIRNANNSAPQRIVP